MDDKFVIAEKYAQGLFDYCKEHSGLEEVKDGLELVKSAAELEPEFLFWLSVPVIPEAERKALVSELVGAFSINKVVEWFLFILIEKKRIRFLPQIYSKFMVLYNAFHHKVDVEVVSAVPLTDSQRQLFLHIWGTYLGRWIDLKERVDDALIGGIKVYYRGWLYDNSVSKRLELLREELVR